MDIILIVVFAALKRGGRIQRTMKHWKTIVMAGSLILVWVAPWSGIAAETPGFVLHSTPADLARWMYPFNGNPAGSPTAKVFASLGSIPIFDSRDAQFLLGWNTSGRLPAGRGAANYLIRRARVTLTIAVGGQYRYTSRMRDYRTYFPTNDPRRLEPAKTDSPVELFGAGYRGGYTAATFSQDGPWSVSPDGHFTNRTVYAAGFDTNGLLVDISNNIGDDKTNEISGPFEVSPFALGESADVAEGEWMPAGSRMTFDLNLEDPLVYGYLRDALHGGHLHLVATSLQRANRAEPPNYPVFYTSFNPVAEEGEYPLLDLEGVVVRPEVDTDGDGLPDDWERFYLGTLASGAEDDPDGDGMNNLAEYLAGTDPSSAASRLRTLSLERNGSVTEIHFTFAPNRQYQLLSSEDLQTWQVATNSALRFSSAWLEKTSREVSYPAAVSGIWRETNASGSPARFYRVSAE